MEKKNLNESISNIVYHFTSIDACINILESNKFFLTLSYGSEEEEGHDNRLFYMSTTRQVNGYIGYQNCMDYSTRICLDGDKLNDNYKGAPFNYFKNQGKQKHIGSKTHDFSYQQKASFDESEDRILSYSPTINNAKKYIKEIDVYTNDNDIIEKLSSFANEITINLYNDPYDFKMKNKKFTILEYKPIESSEIDYNKMERSFRTYKYMLSYIVAIYCIYNGITSSNRIKDLIPKFDVASNINDDYEELEVLTEINNIINDVYTNEASVYSLTSMLKGYTEGSSSKTNDVALLLNLYNKFIRQNNLYDRQNLYNVMLKHISESKGIKVKNAINESLTNVIYHFTSIKSLIRILARNEFNLSFSLISRREYFGNKRLFYMCATRLLRGDVGFSSTQNVRIELDGDKFNQRYNAQPVSFFYHKGGASVKGKELLGGFASQQRHETNESEDRIYSDNPIIPNAKSYIKRIDIFGAKTPIMDELMLVVKKYSDNIDIAIYTNRKDFDERNQNFISIKKYLGRRKIDQKNVEIGVQSNLSYNTALINWTVVAALIMGDVDVYGNFLGDLEPICKYLSINYEELNVSQVKNLIKLAVRRIKDYDENFFNIFSIFNRVNIKNYEDDRLNLFYGKLSRLFRKLGLHSQQQIAKYIYDKIRYS